MRYYEISSGLRMPVSNEEQDILNKVGDGLPDADILDERDQEVTHNMVVRGLLNKVIDKDAKLIYRKNSANDIWKSRF